MSLYGSKKNIVKEDAYRIENPEAGVKPYYFKISKDGATQLDCANKVDNIFNKIYLQYKLNNFQVVIIDFIDIESVGEAFMRKILLYDINSKFKIYYINMSTDISNIWTNVNTQFFDMEDY